MAIPLAKRVQTAYIYRYVLSFCSVVRMPFPFTRGDILAESNEQKRPPRRAAAARACADAGVIGFYCVGCDPWVRVCAPVAAERGRRAETYFDAFLSGGVNRPFSVRALGETLLCYFRAPGIVFLLGFASIGIVAVPLVCACQGFLLSYSLFCFALSLGRGSFPLLLALFGIRLLAVLPCTLLLGNASLDKSRVLLSLSLGGGGRGRAVSYGSAYWYRFGICCVCLLFAALLELWLVPQFLLLAAS